MYEEVVIGFDTRIDPTAAGERWDEARRERFLLRDDVTPLSADEAVWPRTDPQLLSEDGEEGEVRLEILTPRYASLEDALQHADPGEVVIGLTAWRGPGEAELPAGPAWPMKADPEWECIGWDVVSGVFPSALSNCGYGEEDREAWRARWGPELNDHHLFEALPIAFAFRDASTRRLPDHAPLSVLGVYRVR